MTAMQQKPTTQKLALEGLWTNNPVFRQILGICSALAVTNLVLNTLVMSAALTATEIPAGLLPERPTARTAFDDDPALREYNAYLAELAEKDAEKDVEKDKKEQ